MTDSMPSIATTPGRGGGSARPMNSFQSLKAQWEKVERASDINEVCLAYLEGWLALLCMNYGEKRDHS